jgi:hypothetical protein
MVYLLGYCLWASEERTASTLFICMQLILTFPVSDSEFLKRTLAVGLSHQVLEQDEANDWFSERKTLSMPDAAFILDVV